LSPPTIRLTTGNDAMNYATVMRASDEFKERGTTDATVEQRDLSTVVRRVKDKARRSIRGDALRQGNGFVGGLLEFDDGRAAFALDERFGMRSIAIIEFGESEIERVVYDLLIRSRRCEHACFEIDDYDIFIVKVHGRRDTWRPRVIPAHDATVFE